MMTERAQIVSYVKRPKKERMQRITEKNRYLTTSVIVDMATDEFLPKLERMIAKGMLPRPTAQ